ncbi:MAG: hypothetical protein WCT24_02510 [Patescibacteria group bacterium]
MIPKVVFRNTSVLPFFCGTREERYVLYYSKEKKNLCSALWTNICNPFAVGTLRATSIAIPSQSRRDAINRVSTRIFFIGAFRPLRYPPLFFAGPKKSGEKRNGLLTAHPSLRAWLARKNI